MKHLLKKFLMLLFSTVAVLGLIIATVFYTTGTITIFIVITSAIFYYYSVMFIINEL